MRNSIYFLILALFVTMASCNNPEAQVTPNNELNFSISDESVEEAIRKVKEVHTDVHTFRIEKGVKQVAALWQDSDGDIDTFQAFCVENFINDSVELSIAYDKIERNFEVLYGLYNNMTVKLM